jgi:hypothetical protein
VGSESQHLREVAPISGDERVALGILVSDRAVAEEMYHAVSIRNSDDDLVASVPLVDNRGMSDLDPDEYSVFGSRGGELYAVPLGHPPVHGTYAVSLVSTGGEQLATARLRFNCYTEDGTLP